MEPGTSQKSAGEKAAPPTERRSYYRTPLVCPLAYQRLDDGRPTGPLQSATTIDISTKGALLRTHQALELGAWARLQIQLPGIHNNLVAVGRVVRIEEEEPAQKYFIGFAFEKVEPPEGLAFLARLESIDLRQILEMLLSVRGTDLHLATGQAPIVRIQGKLSPLNRPPFRPNEIRALLYSIMTEEQIRTFEVQREMEFAHSLSLGKRFRFNLHWQRGQVEAAIRVIPAQVSGWEQLGIPAVVIEWIRKPSGLILITGPTGSGKTTTLNSLVEHINREREAVIVCLEKPIEYVHQNIKSVVKQREIGSDTLSYAEAVKRALRQDPDVIVVGEIENGETAQMVLNAAETGHLVLASFLAPNTLQAVDRILSLCPPQLRHPISFQLANCLQGILVQHLLPREKAMGGGMVLATEIFIPTEAGRGYIRNNSLPQLNSVIESGGAYRMQSLDRSIRQLVNQGIVASEAAKTHLALMGEQASF